jgi:hypothetical protein
MKSTYGNAQDDGWQSASFNSKKNKKIKKTVKLSNAACDEFILSALKSNTLTFDNYETWIKQQNDVNKEFAKYRCMYRLIASINEFPNNYAMIILIVAEGLAPINYKLAHNEFSLYDVVCWLPSETNSDTINNLYKILHQSGFDPNEKNGKNETAIQSLHIANGAKKITDEVYEARKVLLNSLC